MRYKYTLAFGLASVLPLLLFLYVASRYNLLEQRTVALLLLLGVVLAIFGFLLFVMVIRQVNKLAGDFSRLEKGEIVELGEQYRVSELREMANISNAFNKTLAELRQQTRELEKLVGRFATLSEMIEVASRIPDINQVLKLVLKRTMESVNAGTGSIMLLDEKKKTLSIAASQGLEDDIVKKTQLSLGEGISGHVAKTGETVLVADIENDARFRRTNNPKYGVGSFISMPLRAQTRVMGVLNLANQLDREIFKNADTKFLNTLLGHIGFALENAKLLKESKEAALTLQRVVKEQNNQLQAVRLQVSQSMKLFQQAQKMEAVGTLAGGIAHDFNNLLMGIQGNVSMMLMLLDQGHPNYERLKNIEAYVKSGSDLTAQLLGFARKGKFHAKATDLNQIVKKTSVMFGRARKEVQIFLEDGENLWTVMTDHGQMEQVLLNLYVNAWQAMPGGGKLYLGTKNVLLKEKFVQPFGVSAGRYVRISVKDSGTGMDDATQQRIFEPFFTTKERGRGTGLGLASVYGIVKNHGGLIRVFSQKGHGTEFHIYLPASDQQVAEDEDPTIELQRGTETLLLVDDEDIIIDTCQPLLERLGYRIKTAKSGSAAIEIYKAHFQEIDMVLLDMIMPDMGGQDTFQKLKAINPKVKVLLSSGYSIDGAAGELIDQGCSGFIQKPFKINELSKRIREVFDTDK